MFQNGSIPNTITLLILIVLQCVLVVVTLKAGLEMDAWSWVR